MAKRTIGWMVGFTLFSSVVSLHALADGPLFGFYNPLGLYIGAGAGTAITDQTQYDPIDQSFHRLDGRPLGWNAVIGVRPVPFLGAEAEYLDFGKSHLPAGPVVQVSGTSLTTQFLGSQATDHAAAIFAVGYLPLPIPWVEPFAKLGWGQIWEHDTTSGIYNNIYTHNGTLGFASTSQTSNRDGVAYGAGLQFHIQQLAIRAQYERISSSERLGWNNPALASVGLNWTF
jgi:opacity protein-like surface antigen